MMNMVPARPYVKSRLWQRRLACVIELALDQLRSPTTSGGSFDDRSRWIQAELVPITLT